MLNQLQLFLRFPMLLRSTGSLRCSAIPALRLCSTNPLSDEFAGLKLSSSKVQRFLETISQEYVDLTRTEQRNRAGHRRLATLTPLIQIQKERSLTLENLQQLEMEMKAERDKELLALIEEEKKVRSGEMHL